MSRPSENNNSHTSIPVTNKAAAVANVTHPQGHTITLHADYGFWDETTNKAILPQDLTRN